MAVIDIPSAQFATHSKIASFGVTVNSGIRYKGFMVYLNATGISAAEGTTYHIELPYYTFDFTNSAKVTSIVAGGGISPTEGQIFPRGKQPTG